MIDIRNINNDSIQSYFQWLKDGRVLLNEYIEFELAREPGQFNEEKIEEVYAEPRSLEINEKVSESQKQEWMSRYIEIGRTHSGEKICINIENNLGVIYFYGWRYMEETPIYNIYGDIEEVNQYEVYGFRKVADNFTDFLSKLFS